VHSHADHSRRAGGRKIYTLTHEFFPRRAGIAIFVEELARGAAASGHPIEVWAPDSEKLREHAGLPFPVELLPIRGSEDWPCLWKLSKEIYRRRRELREGTLFLAEPGPVRACMHLGLVAAIPAGRVVLMLYGSEIRRFTRSAHLRLELGRLLRRADRVGVMSGFARKMLLHHFAFAAPKVRLVPGALRHDFALAPAPVSLGARPDDRKIVVLTVARIHPRKGQLCVVEALALLPLELRQRIEYRVVGLTDKAKYLRRLRQTASASGVELSVVGEVSDDALPAAYAEADVFAMTSVPYKDSVEGFGLVYLEAGASGLPVVAHDVGGVAAAVESGETGLLVAPEDRAGLAAAICRLVEDASYREKLGRNGLARARERSWAENAGVLFDGL